MYENETAKLLTDIFTDNYNRLYRSVYPIVKKKEDTEDILQDVFLRAFRANHAKIPKENLFAWLWRISRNTAYTYLTKNSKIKWISLDEYDASIPDFVNALILSEEWAHIFLQLPPKLRQPEKDILINGFSIREAEEKYKIHESQLRYWKYKILRDLSK